MMSRITRSYWLNSITIIVLVAALFVPVPHVKAKGDQSLARSYRFVLKGNVISAGVGLRGAGNGDIDINGIPSGATVFKAYLYWATIGSANTYTSPTLEGHAVNGLLVGTSGDTCWGVQHNFVYRADVTNLVTGNGSYSIAGLPKSLANGNDSQGASLVVVYSAANQPQRTIIINDGAVTLDFNTHIYQDTISSFTPDNPLTDAHITYIVGDGQAMWDTGNVLFNGTSIAHNVFNGVDGQYWGTVTFNVTSLSPTSPSTTTLNDNNPNDPDSPDCLLWAATVFSTTSQPSPGEENQLSKSEQFTLYGDVAAAGIGLRGSGTGNITLSGIPAGAFPQRAFLYWATTGSDNSFTSPTLESQEVNGKLIGTSADTCWGAEHNFVYKADVTSIVKGKGNGSYTIDGLPDSLSDGNDSQGASLVVLFTSRDQPLHRVIVNDGAVTLDFNTHTYQDTISRFTPDNPVTDAHITYLVGDGQAMWDSGNVLFNGTSIAHNVFNGVDGPYWGTITFDVTALTPTDPSTTTINDNDPNNPDSPDCLLWAATLFSITTPAPVYNQSYYLPLVVNNYP